MPIRRRLSQASGWGGVTVTERRGRKDDLLYQVYEMSTRLADRDRDARIAPMIIKRRAGGALQRRAPGRDGSSVIRKGQTPVPTRDRDARSAPSVVMRGAGGFVASPGRQDLLRCVATFRPILRSGGSNRMGGDLAAEKLPVVTFRGRRSECPQRGTSSYACGKPEPQKHSCPVSIDTAQNNNVNSNSEHLSAC